jgi:hypothetical protein
MIVDYLANTKMPGRSMSPRAGCVLCVVIFFLRLACCEEVWSQEQSSSDSLLVSAWEEFYNSSFEEAKALAVACLERNEVSMEDKWAAHLLLAHLAFDAKDTTQALKQLKEVWKEERNYEPPQSLKLKKRFLQFYTAKQPPPPPPYPGNSNKFIIFPEPNVLGWLDINLGVGTNIGVDKKEKNPLLLHARLGLELAELEFRTIEIVNRLSSVDDKRRSELPIVAFKMGISEGSLWRGAPAFTTVFQTDVELWDLNADHFDADSLIYRRDWDSFLLFMSKTFGPIQFHAGGSYTFMNARLEFKDNQPDTSEDNRIASFFAALQVRVRSLAMLMVSFEPIAEYRGFDTLGGVQDPTTQSLLAIGVRAFPLDELSIDMGVSWRISNNKLTLEDITPYDQRDFRIHLGATIGLSLPKIFHELHKP